jgi:hypothetical protein
MLWYNNGLPDDKHQLSDYQTLSVSISRFSRQEEIESNIQGRKIKVFLGLLAFDAVTH